MATQIYRPVYLEVRAMLVDTTVATVRDRQFAAFSFVLLLYRRVTELLVLLELDSLCQVWRKRESVVVGCRNHFSYAILCWASYRLIYPTVHGGHTSSSHRY